MLLIKKIRARFPSKLPIGMTAFKEFVGDIAELSGLPDNDHLRMIISSFVLQLPHNMISYRKWELAKQIIKAAANQVASEAIKLIDEKAKENIVSKPSEDMGQKAN